MVILKASLTTNHYYMYNCKCFKSDQEPITTKTYSILIKYNYFDIYLNNYIKLWLFSTPRKLTNSEEFLHNNDNTCDKLKTINVHIVKLSRNNNNNNTTNYFQMENYG